MNGETVDPKLETRDRHVLLVIISNDPECLDVFLASGYKTFFDLVDSCSLNYHSIAAQLKMSAFYFM